MIAGILAAVVMIPVLATIAGFSKAPHWSVRAFDFARMQIAVLGVVSLAGYGFYFEGLPRDWLVVGAGGLAIAWQIHCIFPYTRFAGIEVVPAGEVRRTHRIRVLVANVLMTNDRSQDLLDLIEESDPDVVLTLETNQWWEDELRELEERYRFVVRCPQENLYGMHLYSRLELEDPEVLYRIQEDVPAIVTSVKLGCGVAVTLHCLHPAPPSPTENATSTERDAELLLVGNEVRDELVPVIVAGDLNDVAWSHTTRLFQKVSRLLDPRIGRGRYDTFHAKYWFIRWPLDHLFHSDHFSLVSLRRLPDFGSDHFPIEVTLHYEPEVQAIQEAPEADAEDLQQAREKIALAGV